MPDAHEELHGAQDYELEMFDVTNKAKRVYFLESSVETSGVRITATNGFHK